ncbi:MAG: hypothetical protein ACM3JG_06590 [Thiohalocapsa sp.]
MRGSLSVSRAISWAAHLAVCGLVAAAGSAWAQSSGNESAQQNVRESQQYEQLLCTNPSFRAKRIAQECGPLQGSQMYAGCVASFQCKGPHRAPHWRKAPPSETIR